MRAATLAALLALTAPAAALDQYENSTLPPPQYDVPYRGELVIYRTESVAHNLELWLRVTNGDSTGSHSQMVAFATHSRSNPNLCAIFLAPDKVIEEQGYTFTGVMRHELGHCNGWKGHDHVGARLVRYGTRLDMPELPPGTEWLVARRGAIELPKPRQLILDPPTRPMADLPPEVLHAPKPPEQRYLLQYGGMSELLFPWSKR